MLVVIIEANFAYRYDFFISRTLSQFMVKFSVPGFGLMRMKALSTPDIVILRGNFLYHLLIIARNRDGNDPINANSSRLVHCRLELCPRQVVEMAMRLDDFAI